MAQKVTILFIICTLILGCKKDKDQGDIPFISVNLSLDIDNPAYRDVKIPGGFIYLDGGSKGIILYRKNNDDFVAYDRHSPIDAAKGCVCTVSEDALFIEDACSNATWLITDGTPQNDNTTRFLLEYGTSFNGRTVRVFN